MEANIGIKGKPRFNISIMFLIHTGAADVIRHLESHGKTIIYVTNNNGKTRVEYFQKFRTLGFPAAKERIFCTSYTSAQYLKTIHKVRSFLFVSYHIILFCPTYQMFNSIRLSSCSFTFINSLTCMNIPTSSENVKTTLFGLN